MDAGRLHLRQQVDRRHRGRNEQDRAEDFRGGQRHRQVERAQIEPGRQRPLAPRVRLGIDGRTRRHEGDEVADVHHAGRIVERLPVDDEARMRRGLEHLDEIAERDVLLHRDYVGARHHHVGDPPLAQAQDVLEHRAFFRREAGVAGRAGL